MSTVVYRLIPPKRPWYVEVNDVVRDMPGWAKVAGVVAAPVAVATFVAAGVELAAVAAVAALGAVVVGAVGLDGSKEALNVRTLDPKEAEGYRDERGRKIAPKLNYLEHPHLQSTLVTAPRYLETIIKEQSAQLMAYIRAIVPVRRVCITIAYGDSAEVSAKAPWFGFGQGTKIEGEVISDCKYDRAEQTAMPDNLYWMTHFPTVVEGLRQARSGTATFSERFERSTHLDLAAARQIGLDSRATREYRLNVAVEFC